MTQTSPHRKVFQGIASRSQMYRMFDRHAQRPNRWESDASSLYAGEWFEIAEIEYTGLFEILPPLWFYAESFAMSEFITGSITSVLFRLQINGENRCFHTYCDLSSKGSAGHMRDAILERERRPFRTMTRDERIEHIWSITHETYRGYTDFRWPLSKRGKRFVRGGPHVDTPKLLDELTDAEIAQKLPVHLRHLPLAVAA